jgi:hypothetical protein
MTSRFSFIYALLAILFFYRPVQAQRALVSEPKEVRVERGLTSLNVNYLGAGLIHEFGISPNKTFLLGLGAHYSFYSSSGPAIFGTRFIDVVDKYFGREYTTRQLTPYALLEARVYTTLAKRAARGKNTAANSANYFALVGEIPFATGDLINVPNLIIAYPIGVKYGLRRPLGSTIYVEGSAALFLKISDYQRVLQPRLDFALAWHPFSR